MDPLENFYQALFFFTKRVSPFEKGIISDRDFPKENELTTEFGISYHRFYESTCKATIIGISQLLKKCKDLYGHFESFNEKTELILQNDESPEDKAKELLKLIQTYGGHTHIVQERVNFNEFSLYRTGTLAKPIEIPTQVSDTTRGFLTVPLETPTPKVRRRRPKRSASLSDNSNVSQMSFLSRNPTTPLRARLSSPQRRTIFNKKSRHDTLL